MSDMFADAEGNYSDPDEPTQVESRGYPLRESCVHSDRESCVIFQNIHQKSSNNNRNSLEPVGNSEKHSEIEIFARNSSFFGRGSLGNHGNWESCVHQKMEWVTPRVEFSGVSASGSSISPQFSPHQPHQQPKQQTQQLLTPTPPPVVLAAPSSPSDGSATCGLCGKKLASQRGLRTHITRTHKGETVPPNTTPIPTIPSTSTPTQTQGQIFVCPDCDSDKITTQLGLVRHRAAHKKNDIYKNMPQPSIFKAEALEDTMLDILGDILKEPNYNDSLKKDFVQGIIDSKGSPAWWNFVNMLNNFISKIVFKVRTNILPANQYETYQKDLNKFLNDNDIELQEKLKSVCLAIDISSSLAGRLVFRIASKLLQNTQVWVLKKLRTTKEQETASIAKPTISEQEKRAFLVHLGTLFQSYFKKKKSSCPRQSQCLKDTFVDGQHPIPSAHFLDSKNWFSGEEWCITPSGRAADFFLSIELEIIPLVKVSKGEVTTQTVIEEVLESQNLLNDWFYLTNDFFDEDASLVFMRSLVGVFVKSSLLLEEKKKNREEVNAIRATTVALRTHLQKNYVEKDVIENVV